LAQAEDLVVSLIDEPEDPEQRSYAEKSLEEIHGRAEIVLLVERGAPESMLLRFRPLPSKRSAADVGCCRVEPA
jgi:hypothetical protein